MALMWVAKCKACGKDSAVRNSTSDKRHLEIPSANRKTRVKCPHCGAVNEFEDRDMKETDVELPEE
jgi:endogenous inhibitor of DNA gyrase (YacG/DUF329 family)